MTIRPHDMPFNHPAEKSLIEYKAYIEIIPRPGTFRRQRIYTVLALNERHAIEVGRTEATQDGYEVAPEASLDKPDSATFVRRCGISLDYPLQRELHDFLKELDGTELPCENNGYCTSSISYSANEFAKAFREGRKLPTYSTWEETVANPALLAAGFVIGRNRWYDGERDSCGPLSRAIHVEREGIHYELWYG